jgi:Spy/CpxP family protein refolding chaperone
MTIAMKRILTILTLSLSACSSGPAKSESPGAARPPTPPPVESQESIAKRAIEAFTSSPDLTADQKQKLAAIYSKTYAEAFQIRQQMAEEKSNLFRMLAKVDYKSKELEQAKKRIVDLDQKRLRLMFDSLEQVQKIVGRGEDKEKIYRHLRDYEIRQDRTLGRHPSL